MKRVTLLALLLPLAASAQKLDPGNLTTYSEYGHAVDSDGTRIAVAAPTGAPGTGGNVVIWVRNGSGWAVEGTVANNEPMFSSFGQSITIQGDTLVVTEPYTQEARVFTHDASGWTLTQTISGVDTGWVTHAIELVGDTLLLGNRIFVRSGGAFVLSQTLDYAMNTGPGLDFDGTRISVGEREQKQGHGRVRIFVRQPDDTFALEQTIAPSGLPMDAWFGSHKPPTK